MESCSCQFFVEELLSITVSKMVARMVRHYDQDEWLHFTGTRQGWYYWKRSQNMEHTIDSELMVYILIPYNWKEYFFTGVVLPAFNLSSRKVWFQVDMKARKDGRLSSSQHLTLLVESPMKKNPVMITQFLKQCTITVIGNVIKMPCIGQQSTRSRIAILANEVTCDHRTQSCASRLHLQSSLSKRRSNTVRKTLNLRPAPKVTLKSNWHSQQQQQQSLCDDVSTSTRRLVRDPEPAEINLRVEGVSQDATVQDEEKMKRNQWTVGKVFMGSGTKSIRSDLSKGKSRYLRHGTHAVDRTETNLGGYSSVFLAWSTYKRDWTCVNAAPGFDPIKVRWTESEQHLQRWKLLSTVPQYSRIKRKEKWSQPMADGSSKKPWMQQEEYWNAANTPLYWTDCRTTKYTECLKWYTVGLTSGSSTYISKIDISHDAPHRQQLRYKTTIFLRRVDSNEQAGP